MARPTSALLIDDEAHVRAYLRLLLAELGITRLWEAADGREGLRMAQTERPGVVLLDINLPQLNGIELLRQLRETDPDLPVIVVTSQTAIQTVHDAERLGAVAYLLKHSPREEALDTLREALDAVAEE